MHDRLAPERQDTHAAAYVACDTCVIRLGHALAVTLARRGVRDVNCIERQMCPAGATGSTGAAVRPDEPGYEAYGAFGERIELVYFGRRDGAVYELVIAEVT